MGRLAELLDNLARQDGWNPTLVEGVGVYRASEYRGREPLCYNQGLIIVGQGEKRVFFGDQIHEYNPDAYLVLSVPLPAECETYASAEEPLLAMTVDIDVTTVNRIIGLMGDHLDHELLEHGRKHAGLYTARVTPAIGGTAQRLLEALQDPLEAGVLGKGLVFELLFRVMCGENAASLYALAMKNTNLSRIDKALKLIHSDYQQGLTVDTLSSLVNMSPSAFHRAFQDVTSSSPIQYIKKIRLNRAKDLLLGQSGARVNEVASVVGYESAAQFSREFKRYYGSSPKEFAKKELAELN